MTPQVDKAKLQDIFDALQLEGDRACAVLGLATIDALLGELLRLALIKDPPKELFEDRGAFSTLSSKIDIAYALGLIAKEDRRDLHLLRKIRNEFAHAIDHELSFGDQKIKSWINALTTPKLFENTSVLQGNNDTIRFRFELAVGVISVTLSSFRKRGVITPKSPLSIKPGKQA